MRAQAKRPRRIWPLILALVVVVIAVIATLATNAAKAPTTPGASPSESPSASASPTAVDAAPTGCLGGKNRNGEMVLTASTTSAHSTNGGIEAAAAFVRWLNQYPYPDKADIQMVESDAVSTNAPTKDIAGFFATEPNLSGGLVPDRTEYYLSTLPGVYHLESSSTDKVVATIGTALVIKGAMSTSLKGSITVTVVWDNDVWKFVSSKGTRTTEDLFAIGRPFTAGC
jgi:hypothetical protein